MFRSRLESTNRRLNVSGRKLGQFSAGFSRHPFGKRRPGGNGCRTAARQEAGFGHTPVRKARRKPQHVAAGWIRDVNHHCGGRKFAGVTRILEMVEQTLARHSCFNYP